MKIKTGLAVGILQFVVAGSVWAHGGIEHADAVEAAEHVITNVPLGFQGAKEMMSIHPLFVHFPIALLSMVVVFYFLGILFKKEGLLQAGKWTLWTGTLSAAVAVWTGLKAAYTAPHNDEVHQIMELHEHMGYAILGISAILSAWIFLVKVPVPKRGRVIFLGALVLLGLILIQQADLGGRMVFLHGTGVGQKSMLQQAQPSPLRTHADHEKMGH